jgi:hypothetical protein
MTAAMLRIPASMRMVLACAWGCAGGWLSGCEGSKGTAVSDAAAPDDGAVSIEECDRTAPYYCERLFSCTPTIGRTTYATMDECIAQDATDCRLQGTLGGVSPTALRNWVACNMQLGALDCNDFRFAPVPACDATPGTRLESQACMDDAQCASAFCRSVGAAGSGFAACGRCALRTALGGPCDDTTLCERSVCVSGRCSLYSGQGGPCATTAECLGDLACVEGFCGPPRALGAPCTISDTCGENACVSGVCAVLATSAPGEACSATVPCRGYTFYCDAATSRCAHIPRAGEPCSASDDRCPYLHTCQQGRCTPLTEEMCVSPPDAGAR